MRPGVQVCPAGPGDLDALVQLCLAARSESGVGTQLCTDDADRLRDQLGAFLGAPGGRVLVGSVDGEPAGMLLARIAGPSLFTDVVSLNLEVVFVLPDARRRGLGHLLLATVADEADRAGASEVYATPLPGSRGMQRFLAQLGFAPAAAHRVVTTSALQRRLAHEPAATTGAIRRSGPRGLEDLIARRRQARAARTPASGDQVASITMQVNRAVQMRRPSASSTTTW
ncbi:GNAT family N-acetyltransferase [Cellulomonas sp. HZM]|uniref:GNAT family N-acetyltransferase n=1 Tax=Cellulomonas sp. HZM TaxID=1454010 RepID=UPI000492ECF1|nr:GNAT family N-acetyltransferase [Cellulomonas sp. HZM]